jgi:mannose-1-phosphate guanylyltransferase/mannose-6-phosphate isomerase
LVRVLSEPMGRNTAPAIGVAAALFSSWGVDPSFAVLPADHAIENTEAFSTDLEESFGVAERDPFLVTLGIRPTGPETNFGYIHRGSPLGDRLYRVARFTEKPDRDHAMAWVASGEYAWNSGIFVWRCSTFQLALEASRPELAGALATLRWTDSEDAFERQLGDVFPRLESISVDYAVLEHAPNVVMIEASFDWDDLGSWSAWARRQPHDARGNVLFGDAYALDCDGCVVVGDGGVAAAMGVSGMVVVHTNGATLACRLEDSDNVRRISTSLKAKGGS